MQQAPSASCPSCSGELPSGAVFCPRCGTPTPTRFTGGGVMTYTSPTSAEEASQREQLQRLLGDACELRGRLGRGGFADVYEAWDVRLKRSLAVKTLRTDLSPTVQLVERFRREAEAIAQLRHPHVIPIYTVGGEGSVGYFVMPKVDGGSLAMLLATEARLPVAEACRIVREAASALAVAHRAGIIHRDIKPENILLDGPERRVLVTDFGIAKSMDTASSGLTGTGMLVGTPHYMSPEQAAGDPVIDHRSDQYALATLGYQMLTGQLPFDGDSAQTVIFRQVSEPPTPIAELAPEVPAGVAAVIERALAKRPADRFENIEAFDQALGRALQEGTVNTSRTRLPDFGARLQAMRASLPGRRSPITIVAALGLVVGAVLLPRTIYRAAYEHAGSRESAVFAARSFMATQGLSSSSQHFAEFRTGDTLHAYRFLRETIGGRRIAERADQLPLWVWRVTFRPPADVTRYYVELGIGNRLVAHGRQIPDSASAASVAAADAEPIAVREMAARGWSVETLARLPDSVVTLTNRTDHIIRWANPASAIPWDTRDTARTVISVRVTGGDVTSFRETLHVPVAFRQQNSEAARTAIVGLVVLLTMLVGVGVAIALIVTRSRRDELQWKLGFRIALAVIVSYIPIYVAHSVMKEWVTHSAGETPIAVHLAGGPLLGAFIVALLLLAYVVVESMSAEHRPGMFGGVGDLARGRLTSPEVVSGVVHGALWGLITMAALQLVALGNVLATGAPISATVPDLVHSPFPTASVLEALGDAASVVVFLALAQLVIFQWTRRPALAVGVVTAIAVALSFVEPDGTFASFLSTLTRFGILSAVLWRYGLMAAGVTIFVAEALLSLIAMFLAGAALGGALLAVMVFALPFAAAAAAYQRVMRVRVSTKSAVTS